MKIVTVGNYYPEHIGGIEFVSSNLVKRWRSLHHQVSWIACDDPTRPHRSEADDLPLPAWNFAERHLGFPYPIPLGSAAARIAEQVKACDVVHLHDCLYAANWIAYISARRYGKPVLVTQHAALASFPQAYKRALQHAAYRTLGRTMLRRADQVVFISRRVQAWFSSWMGFRRPSLLIPNGVDRQIFFPSTTAERLELRQRLGLPLDQRVLVFVGRFAENKGVNVLREVSAARPESQFLMFGSGRIRPQQWGLPNVRVFPPQSQTVLRDYYAAADMFILPSVGEGFPLSVQEAMSCGAPAAVACETAEYLPDAPLVRLDVSSLPNLLQTIDELLSSEQRRAALSASSTQYALQWDWDIIAARYLDEFAALQAREGRPA